MLSEIVQNFQFWLWSSLVCRRELAQFCYQFQLEIRGLAEGVDELALVFWLLAESLRAFGWCCVP